MDVPAQKQCRKCDAPKPATPEYFYRKKTCKDGLTTLCKVHSNENHTRYVQNNRPRIRECKRLNRLENLDRERAKSKERYWKNPQKERAANKANYQKHRETRIAAQQRYYFTHREERLAYHRQYQITNREMLCLKDKARWEKRPPEQKLFHYKAWQQRHPKLVKRLRKQWRKNHPGYNERSNRTRRARRKLATVVDTFTMNEIGTRDHWICHLCKKKVRRKDASIDHHFPFSKPGAIHGRQYVSLSHIRCNSARGNGRPGHPVQLRLLP